MAQSGQHQVLIDALINKTTEYIQNGLGEANANFNVPNGDSLISSIQNRLHDNELWVNGHSKQVFGLLMSYITLAANELGLHDDVGDSICTKLVVADILFARYSSELKRIQLIRTLMNMPPTERERIRQRCDRR